MNKFMKNQKKIEKSVVSGYKAIENGVVSGYKAIEDGVISGYKKIEDKFVESFITEDGETVEDAKKRIKENSAPHTQPSENKQDSTVHHYNVR